MSISSELILIILLLLFQSRLEAIRDYYISCLYYGRRRKSEVRLSRDVVLLTLESVARVWREMREPGAGAGAAAGGGGILKFRVSKYLDNRDEEWVQFMFDLKKYSKTHQNFKLFKDIFMFNIIPKSQSKCHALLHAW